MNKKIMEGIMAEMPGNYCLYCGIPLETEEEKEEEFCEDHYRKRRGKDKRRRKEWLK